MQINKENFFNQLKKQFPASKIYWKKNQDNFHFNFMELSSLTIQAHKERNKYFLNKTYSFAEASIHSKDKEIYNAVGTSFFENIIKNSIVRKDIAKYISRKTLYKVLNLWRWSLGKKSTISSLLKNFGFTSEEIKKIDKEPIWINNRIYPFNSKILKKLKKVKKH